MCQLGIAPIPTFYTASRETGWVGTASLGHNTGVTCGKGAGGSVSAESRGATLWFIAPKVSGRGLQLVKGCNLFLNPTSRLL